MVGFDILLVENCTRDWVYTLFLSELIGEYYSAIVSEKHSLARAYLAVSTGCMNLNPHNQLCAPTHLQLGDG